MDKAILSGLLAAALTSMIFVADAVANGYAQSSDVTSARAAAVSSSTQGTVVRYDQS